MFSSNCDRGAQWRRQVLILAPFRSSAAAVVRRLWALAQAETRTDSVQHRERFLDDFGGGSDGDEGGEDEPSGAGRDQEHCISSSACCSSCQLLSP